MSNETLSLMKPTASDAILVPTLFPTDNDPVHKNLKSPCRSRFKSIHKTCALLALASSLLAVQPAKADFTFNLGDIVISTVSNQVGANPLDTASPLVLQQFQLGAGGTSVTADGSLILPQTASGSNSAISGEFGSASEGILQQSADGHYLTIMGYGVNATSFNTAPLSTYGTAALGQTTSVSGTLTVVPRVVALIGADGSVDTSTALTGVFNMNNPRSVATVDGSSFYVSGQGVTGDGTGGLFYALKGATTATAINANTSSSPSGTNNPAVATETRVVEIVNTSGTNTLEVSRDFKVSGTPNDATDIRSFTNSSGALPTGTTGLVATRVTPNTNSVNGGNTSSIDLTSSLANGVNSSRVGKFVYLSPEEFFYANATTLYIADSGQPKNGSSGAAQLGEGGLQKWVLSGTTWSLAYDLVNGLALVSNTNANSNTPTAAGVTGLFGLTGKVVGGTSVELFATSYGLNELSPSYVYEITDNLSATSISQVGGEQFATLLSDTTGGTLYRGIAFAPTAAVPEPGTYVTLLGGLGLLALLKRRRKSQ